MLNGYKNLDEKPYESHYLHVESIIDRPVAEVWPHALKIGAWMSAHRLETIAGEPGHVGHFERVWPQGMSETVPLPHYHLYGIAAIIPFKYIALEVIPERGGSYGNTREWVSFDGILFTDLGARTQLTFLMVDVELGHGDESSRQRKRDQLADGRSLLKKYFDNLKNMVERGN